MLNGAKIVLEYLGGVDVLYLTMLCLAFTQLFKMLLRAVYGFVNPDMVRPFPYVVGAFAGLVMIDFSSRGAMVGVVCGMMSSLGYYWLSAWLERESAPAWQRKIAARMALR